MNNMRTELLVRYPCLEAVIDSIDAAAQMMVDTYKNGGTVLVCGNGGSCADSDHIVGELMKGFLSLRPMSEEQKSCMSDILDEDILSKLQRGIPAISLPAQSAVISAYANDVDPELVYAQLVFGYGKKQDMLIGLSTSGNSKNVVAAAKVARAMGIKTLALTGARDSRLSELCDVTVKAPEIETFKVQELHLPIYHYLCAYVEKYLVGGKYE
ncbi:MAG: SIS domain-containing protein [Clostridia bacterium]|nr:SIS domain-containing protein [Clostridia bacterium]